MTSEVKERYPRNLKFWADHATAEDQSLEELSKKLDLLAMELEGNLDDLRADVTALLGAIEYDQQSGGEFPRFYALEIFLKKHPDLKPT